MGDFVDRGFYSVESFLLLLALKVRYGLLPDANPLIGMPTWSMGCGWGVFSNRIFSNSPI